ncbi:methyltransferase OMS1 [Magnaporthiopsis poae ATCC 64411]|uniref:Methyltransferase OMS1 n=1 Tax=Magnaporthiopsis poae (strain ATCC 64411 / 73-15) TaxID=644358 RepID=A0A0C4DZW9_MAGP6|nr:methyltransferase OMS1 [Magnaporthiopsis poae ATCC 64411]
MVWTRLPFVRTPARRLLVHPATRSRTCTRGVHVTSSVCKKKQGPPAAPAKPPPKVAVPAKSVKPKARPKQQRPPPPPPPSGKGDKRVPLSELVEKRGKAFVVMVIGGTIFMGYTSYVITVFVKASEEESASETSQAQDRRGSGRAAVQDRGRGGGAQHTGREATAGSRRCAGRPAPARGASTAGRGLSAAQQQQQQQQQQQPQQQQQTTSPQETSSTTKPGFFSFSRRSQKPSAALPSALEEPTHYDVIVQTFGLCSVASPGRLLANMAAVVKPGTGRILLLEHGRGDWGFVNKALDRLAPSHFARFGCWWNRDIERIVREAAATVPGLEVVSVKRPGVLQAGTTLLIELRVAEGGKADTSSEAASK